MDDDADPSSRRLVVLVNTWRFGVCRLEEALRVLRERATARRRRLDSPSGFHTR